MPQTVLVTGATGLVGSNLCRVASTCGVHVRAMVRTAADAESIAALGADPVLGDINDTASLTAAAKGVEGVIHLAALIGGTWSTHTAEEFDLVNYQGALKVLDAARDAGAARTILINSVAILDWSVTMNEQSPLAPIRPTDSGYKRAKRSLYYAAMHRASRGQDVIQIVPGDIYGPAPLVERSLVPTSFNAAILLALRGELDEYVRMPMTWVFVDDVVELSLAALERGTIGERYLAFGEMGRAMSLAEWVNRAAELAGIDHRVRDVELTDDAARWGSMATYAGRTYADPLFDSSATTEALGYEPIALDEGLSRTIAWLRQVGEL